MDKVKIATHSGIFHADEVFAIAVLKLYFEKQSKDIEVTRTRNLEIIANCDIAVDVGEKYHPEKNIYDHHQKEKPVNRPNGIPYASFGLIWKHFGKSIVSNEKVWEAIERKLVTPIDATDSSVNLYNPIYPKIYEYGLGQVIRSINHAHNDDQAEMAFAKALEIALLVLSGEINKTEKKVSDEEMVESLIVEQNIPEILVLEKFLSWESSTNKYENIKLVIFPDKIPFRWCIQAVPNDPDTFGGDRIKFPETWRSLTDQALAEVTGVEEALFCHTGGFFAVAKTKESALKLATIAINYPIVG
jgi:uncharacterized UPF0160 family protein